MTGSIPNRQPFMVVPWEQDFLQALADALIKDYAPDMDQVLLVFPHARPARYLRRILADRPDLPKPCLLPAMSSLPLFISNLAAEVDMGRRGSGNHKESGPVSFPLPRTPAPFLAHIGEEDGGVRETDRERVILTPNGGEENDVGGMFVEPGGGRETQAEITPRQTAHVLDQVAVLREAALQAAQVTGHTALAAVASDARCWLPWGTRLAALMEDIFNAGIATPGDFSYLEGSVPPFAVALLENLSVIHKIYITELDRRQLTTPGYDGRLVLEAIREGGRDAVDWRFLQGRRVILAGFYGLGGVEEGLFKHLWLNHGARIFLHSDACVLSEPDAAHWSCEGHALWLKNWNAAASLADIPSNRQCDAPAARCPGEAPATRPDAAPAGPKLSFYQGYDLHSQLAGLHDLLAEQTGPEGQAQPEEGACEDASAGISMTASAGISAAPPTLSCPDAYEDAAVALLDSGLLMPLLHHLPRKNVNISMGYPLERSPLARLVELMLRLQESRRGGGAKSSSATSGSPSAAPYPASASSAAPSLEDGFAGGEVGHALNATVLAGDTCCSRPGEASLIPQSGFRRGEGTGEGKLKGLSPLGAPSPGDTLTPIPVYHWRAVVNLLRHPYLRMLERDGERPFQTVLALLEKEARGGARFIDPRRLAASPEYARALTQAGLDPAPVPERIARLLEVTVTAWEGVSTLAEVADNLARLADFLLEEGRDLWPRFPLDGEYLFRLSEHLAPQLAQSAFAAEVLDKSALFALLREAVRGERVPFEAEPLEGLQILGMLETRLLSFERVYILDATDDRLPGAPAHDPLLPDALRRELGLPGLAQRELAMAYTFNRLIRSAREVAVFYQTGAGSGGLLDEKKVRSRFVEELIWAEEKRRGALLAPGEPPLHSISFQITPAASIERGLPKTAIAARALDAWLQKPVSATALDAYLRCPLQFFYARLAGLTPPDVVREGDDPAGVGEFLHAVLQEFFAARLNAPLFEGFPTPQDEEHLANIYSQKLAGDPDLGTALPYASYLMLKTTGLARLKNALRQTPPGTRILALETMLSAPLEVNGRVITLHGKLDRVDARGCGEGEDGVWGDGVREGKPQGAEPLEVSPPAAPPILNPDWVDEDKGDDRQEGELNSGLNGASAVTAPGVDFSQGHIMILDYKSGQVRESAKRDFWTPRNPLWRAMEEWTPDTPQGTPGSGGAGSEALAVLADGLKTLQLPVYMYLYQQRHPQAAVHAAFVDLARSGAEKPLFPEGLLKGETGADPAAVALRGLYAAYIPRLPHFVLRHMLECREFTPRPGGHCAWCQYQPLCRRGV